MRPEKDKPKASVDRLISKHFAPSPLPVDHVRIEDGDDLLLCSDGLTDMVDEDEISSTLSAHSKPQDACQALLDRALDNGGKDNITMVLARYSIPERQNPQAEASSQ